MPLSNTIIILSGPTAVGKTALAVELARQLGTEIISADSRQCYRELNIGVAKPSETELAEVAHHFINSHSIHEPVNAAGFAEYALEKAASLFRKFPVVVMVGGTGMYIKAFADGLDYMPGIDAAVREDIRLQYQSEGMAWLQGAVKSEDPEFYSSADTANPHRLMRALEVKRSTGASIRQFQQGQTAERPFRIIRTALELPREILRERIDRRVEQMIAAGLEKEVESLLPFASHNALQTVGYREWMPYFKGGAGKEEVIKTIQANTRQYAKRQMTWFRRDSRIRWFDARKGEKWLEEMVRLSSG